MSRFDGLPGHIERYAGRVRGADSRETGGRDTGGRDTGGRDTGGRNTGGRNTGRRDRGYHLVYCDGHDGSHVTVLTSGLREHTAGAPLPQELLCTVHATQELHGKHLTGVIAELLTESASRVGYGALIMNDRALLPETEIAGALAAPHPYFADDFDVLLDGDGRPVLQLITLLPITRGEAQLVSRYGKDVLYDRWEQHGTDLTDVRRRSVG